jgi:replication factor C subunit 3/5
MNTYCPFVEKHRPKKFDDIVLDPINKKILKSIIETLHFPNVLFYGPPGTGKTTTIINAIREYQEKTCGHSEPGLTIHLNASDERGIDIIRNQISSFVSSRPLFSNGIKFVILDEVDYMTKNAQQALKYLLEEYPNNVRFCLICNYISKIDEGLQNEFLKLRFDQLPKDEVVAFLEKLSKEEEIDLNKNILNSIQKLFKSDLRSMVNYIQTNQDMLQTKYHIINDETWEEMFNIVSNYKTISKPEMISHVHQLSIKYNIDIKNIIVNFLNYIIRYKKQLCSPDFFLFTENIIHSRITNDQGLLYLFNKLIEFIEKEDSSS